MCVSRFEIENKTNFNRNYLAPSVVVFYQMTFFNAIKSISYPLFQDVLRGDKARHFQCKICIRSFSGKQGKHKLKRHEIIHTKENPYSCGQCNINFNR